MNFLALIVGLMIERLLTRFFHLREFHWLDSVFDFVYKKFAKASFGLAVVGVVALTLALVAPIAWIGVLLDERLAHIPAFIYAVAVLLFCLGPRDLVEEVDDYEYAVKENDPEEWTDVAAELLERHVSDSEAPPDIEQAIYAQANNRIFGTVFWFFVLGPAGAWMFRVLDLMRQSVVVHAEDDESNKSVELLEAVRQVHRILAWIPARLLMIGYMLAGSYDGALQAWRSYRSNEKNVFAGLDGLLLATVAQGAVPSDKDAEVGAKARAAIDLVRRVLWMIWCPALALLTVYGWIA